MTDKERAPGGARMQEGGDWGEFLDPQAAGSEPAPPPEDVTDQDEETAPLDPVEEASKESFPASDPPSFTPERIGPPHDPPPE